MSKRNRERRMHSYIDTVPYNPRLAFSRDALVLQPLGDESTPFEPIGYDYLLAMTRNQSRDEFESA